MSNGTAPRVGQRNFKKVFKGGNYLKPKKWEEWGIGDFVEGEYVNASELDKFGKPIYEIKVHQKQITGADPEIRDGDRQGIMPLYPNGGLITQMDEASYGDIVKITYLGKSKVTNKKSKWYGTVCHNVEVQIDGYVHPDEAAESESDLLG